MKSITISISNLFWLAAKRGDAINRQFKKNGSVFFIIPISINTSIRVSFFVKFESIVLGI